MCITKGYSLFRFYLFAFEVATICFMFPGPLASTIVNHDGMSRCSPAWVIPAYENNHTARRKGVRQLPAFLTSTTIPTSKWQFMFHVRNQELQIV
jgi:hypothetical protein